MGLHQFTVITTILASGAIGAGFLGFAVAFSPAVAISKDAVTNTARQEVSFANVSKLDIRNLRATVTMTVGTGDVVTLSYTLAGEPTAISFEQVENVLKITGPDRITHNDYNDIFDWHNTYRKRKERESNWKDRVLTEYLADYPELIITLPAGTDVEMERSIAKVTANDGLGHVVVGKGMITGTFGDIESGDFTISSVVDLAVADVRDLLMAKVSGSADFQAQSAGELRYVLSGSGDMTIGDVAGSADAVISGSGDTEVGTVGKQAVLVLSGSGDIQMRDIGGATSLVMSGSGDVDLGNVDGDIDILISGSGNVDAKAVTKGADLQVSGSGNIDFGTVNGITRVNISGNGNVDIEDGLAENLVVKIYGNGRFVHRGQSTNLDAAILGNGSIEVYNNTGTLQTSARSGTIRVNGKKIAKNKDYR